MTSTKGPIEQLRERARRLIVQAGPEAGVDLPRLEAGIEALVEEIRVHEVELELQNQELLKSQAQFRNLKRRYATLFENLPLAALVVTPSGVIAEANAEAASLFGYRSPKQLENHSIYRLLSGESRALVAEGLKTSGVGQAIEIDRVNLVPEAFEEPMIELHLAYLPEDYHLDRHILITCVDRTEHYRHERESNLLRTIMDNTDAEVTVFNRRGECVYLNRSAAEAIGADPAELIGVTRQTWMSETEARREHQQDSMVFSSNKSWSAEERRDSEAGRRCFLAHRFPVTECDFGVSGVAKIATEITQRKRDETRLELVMAAFRKGHEGIMITDSLNRFVAVNPAFERITGYREEEVLGKDPGILSSGREDATLFHGMWEGIQRKGFWEGEVWNRDKRGRVYPIWLSISSITSEGSGANHYIGVFTDITKRKLVEQEMEQLAFYDSLTGVPNRFLLSDRVTQAIHRANREKKTFALAFFDLDRFKQINDVHGHDVGDQMLQQAAKRVGGVIRENDTLSRLGGDEFVLVLEDIAREALEERLVNLIELLSLPYLIEGKELESSASLGVAMYPSDGKDFNTLLKNADTAMYRAKEAGRGTFVFFGGEMAEAAKARLELATELRSAVRDDKFELAFQPQLSLQSGKVVGVEALLRWPRGSGNYLSPANFIPLAEQAGIINEVGEWVIRQTFSVIADYQKQHQPLRFAVNVSAKQFESEGFFDVLKSALDQSGIEASAVEIEITENVAMHNPEASMALMRQLKAIGFNLAVDDFGTGYSSLSYLHWMPVDNIKIDQAFIARIGRDAHHETICRSIIRLGSSLDIRTTAEGVETAEQLSFLRQAGCDAIQGYLLSPPLHKNSLEEWIASYEDSGIVGIEEGFSRGVRI